jgi:cephalosporin-C deacetylase-like acetyl esterase
MLYYTTVSKDTLAILKSIMSAKTFDQMKLSAIGGRGTKKDFVDLYFLLQEFTLNEMIETFLKKFPIFNTSHVFKSLTYFDDADKSQMPTMLNDTTWEQVKSGIIKHVRNFKF